MAAFGHGTLRQGGESIEIGGSTGGVTRFLLDGYAEPDVAAFLQHPAIAQIMEKVPDAAVAHIKYCRFGKKYQKATAIVTNSVHVKRRLDDIMANNRWPNRCKACHESERHKESVRHDNCRSAAWLPKPLCQVINEEIIAELNL